MNLRIFLILFRPLPAGETWRYETGMTPFSPDRQTEKRVQDAGAQDADLEPWSLRGRQAGPAEIASEPLTSMLIVLGGPSQLSLLTLNLLTVKTLAALSLPLGA